MQWPPDTSALHHWAALESCVAQLSGVNSVADRLDRLVAVLEMALSLYALLEERQVVLDQGTNPGHLHQWIEGTREFRERAKI